MKHISYQSGHLLKVLHDKGKTWFTSADLESIMNKANPAALRKLVSDMTKRGLLMKVKAGVYYIIPYDTEPENYLPDWHLLAEPLANKTKYYIGYYSAMQLHGLITQPSFNEIIVTEKQVKPAVVKIKDIEFRFIYHNKKHFFGSKKHWVNNYDKVYCSDLEKTIVDCLYKPEIAGGIVEIAKAIHMSKDKIKYDQLLEYVKRFDAQSVIKRLGYLLELFNIETTILASLQQLKTKSWIPLDTEQPKLGTFNSKWSILENIDKETILQAPTT
jgi:predicted transcriptional regulator of viral defense system